MAGLPLSIRQSVVLARCSGASKPHFAAGDGAPHRAQDPQDDADDHQDAADRVQDAEAGEIADNEKDNAEDNHGRSDLRDAAACAAQLGIPVARLLNPGLTLPKALSVSAANVVVGV
jgi:hypothetical protein